MIRALLLLSILLPGAVAAETTHGPTHGIAMHGDLALPPGFAALPYVNPAAPKGGTLRQAVTGSFDTLNPHVVKGVPAVGLGLTFESLLARSWDEPFSLYGLLAESLEVADDRSAVTFHLNPKARWHDGTPLTAADVLFSLEVQRVHGTPNRRLFYAKVTAAEAPDPLTVRFVFAANPDGSPNGGIDREMPLLMGLMPIHSKAWWAGKPFERTILEPILGSGPYRVAAVDPGRRITYARVPDYWGRDLPVRLGQFNADRLDYVYYRDDSVALEAFKAGEGDVRRETDPAKWATGYDGPALRDGRIEREELAHHRPDAARGLIFNTRRPLFADVRVRRALGMATDFAWMGRTLFHGLLTRTASYYPNSELAARGLPQGEELRILDALRDRLPPELFTQPFALPQGGGGGRAALREALRLLAEAGWRIRDGRLADADGHPFAFEILLADPSEERIALEFARSLDRLGIAASVRAVDSAQFQARLERFDFDMTLRWWASTLSPGNEQLYYYGSEAAGQEGSRNLPGIRDPAVDTLARSIAEATTRADLVARVRALDRVLLWGHYMVPLFHSPVDRLAHWTRLKRPAATPLYGPLIESWWIEDGR